MCYNIILSNIILYTMAIVGLRNLCTPAYIYLVISIISILVIGIQNMGNANAYCLGSYSCYTKNKVTIFIMKIIYVLFFTWILNILCKSGYETVSWVLVLLPYVLMFIIISLMFLSTFPYDDGRYTTVDMWTFF
jgi:hypothetical protein